MSFMHSIDPSHLTLPRVRFPMLALAVGMAFASLFVFSLFARPASAAVCSFMSVGTNDFNTAGNWTCGQVPTSFDDVMVGSGTTTNLSAAAIVQSVSVSGTLNAVSFLLDVTSTATVLSGGVVTSTTGTMKFNSVTSTGSIGSVSGNAFVTTTFQNNGTLNIGSGTVTSTGNFRNAGAGVLNGGSGILSLLANFNNSSTATFTPGSGTIRYAGSGTQIMAATVYNNLSFIGSGTYNVYVTSTVAGNVTLTGGTLSVTSTVLYFVGTTTIGASGTLALGDATLTAVGLITNAGTITQGSSGTINHTAESAALTDSSGSAVSSFTEGDTVYVNVQDSNRNLLGDTAETMTITISHGNVATTGDQETFTLTETGVATGIFRSAGALLSYAVSATQGNGTFQASAAGTFSGTYTDTQDAEDTTAFTKGFTMTTTASTQTSTGGGGLSSGGGGGSPVYAIPQTIPLPTPVMSGPYVKSDVLASAPSINADKALVLPAGTVAKCTSGSLIKLMNDGNTMTHEDEAVYYCGADGKRYAFPNAGTFFSWYNDFSAVVEVSASTMASLSLGGNVTYRPGVRMVKIQTDPKVYAIMKGGVLRWVSSEAVARTLYGDTWNTMISDVPDTFFTNYIMGSPIN